MSPTSYFNIIFPTKKLKIIWPRDESYMGVEPRGDEQQKTNTIKQVVHSVICVFSCSVEWIFTFSFNQNRCCIISFWQLIKIYDETADPRANEYENLTRLGVRRSYIFDAENIKLKAIRTLQLLILKVFNFLLNIWLHCFIFLNDLRR